MTCDPADVSSRDLDFYKKGGVLMFLRLMLRQFCRDAVLGCRHLLKNDHDVLETSNQGGLTGTTPKT